MCLARLVALPVVVVLAGAGVASAHDFASGPNMGLPPKRLDARQQLSQILPSDLPEATRGRVRGVFDRAKQWPFGSVLTVCFLSGSQKARTRVAEVASEWNQHIGVRLDFGDMGAPRMCSGRGNEHIKIDFFSQGPDSGNWSYIGIDSLRHPHSLNLHAMGSDVLPVGEDEMRAVTLHEFGHALGFEHEHQNPQAKCEAEFDEQKLSDLALRWQWSEAEVRRNLRALQPSTSLEVTRHDIKSIMHYSLPEELFRGGKTNKCWVEKNKVLSDGDKSLAAKMYPRLVASADPRGGGAATGAVAAAPAAAPRGTTRSVGPSAETLHREELERAFSDALRESGMPREKQLALTERFKRELATLRDKPPPRTPAKKN